MAGYVKYMRSVPNRPNARGCPAVKPQAIVHVRRFPMGAFLPVLIIR